MANTRTTPSAAPPTPPIYNLLTQDMVTLINATPEQLNPLRGLIRQQLNLAVPKDLFIPGNSQAIFDWIVAHYKPRPSPAQTPYATATNRALHVTAAPANTIAVDVEFATDVTGRVDFSRRDFYRGTVHIPRVRFDDCADEEEIAEVIRGYIIHNEPYELNVERYGDHSYGDEGDTDNEIQEDSIEINSDTAELFRTLGNNPNPP